MSGIHGLLKFQGHHQGNTTVSEVTTPGRAGLLAWTNADVAGIVKENLFRPAQFMTVYGMNMGGYVGGFWGRLVVFRGLCEGERQNNQPQRTRRARRKSQRKARDLTTDCADGHG